MGDSEGNVIFESLLEASHVLQSLKETLRQMLEGSYISKRTADSIMEEAARQYHCMLKNYRQSLPAHYLIGHLRHYSRDGGNWTFNVDNVVMFVGTRSTMTGGRPNALPIEYKCKPGSPAFVQSTDMFLRSSKAFCYQGCIKIKAIVE